MIRFEWAPPPEYRHEWEVGLARAAGGQPVGGRFSALRGAANRGEAASRSDHRPTDLPGLTISPARGSEAS